MAQLDFPARITRVRLKDAQYEQLALVLRDWPGRLYGDEDMMKILNHRRDKGHPQALGFAVTRTHIGLARRLHRLHPPRTAMTGAERRELALHLAWPEAAAPVVAEPSLAGMPTSALLAAARAAHEEMDRLLTEFNRRQVM